VLVSVVYRGVCVVLVVYNVVVTYSGTLTVTVVGGSVIVLVLVLV